MSSGGVEKQGNKSRYQCATVNIKNTLYVRNAQRRPDLREYAGYACSDFGNNTHVQLRAIRKRRHSERVGPDTDPEGDHCRGRRFD